MVRRQFSLVLIAALLSVNFGAASATEHAEIDAIWRPQRLAFNFSHPNVAYSCAGLQRKLNEILLGLGVRDDIQILRYGCSAPGDASLEIAFFSPVEATPENIASLTTYDARDALRARVRGEALASAAELPRFKAEWREISFARNRRMRLSPWDCELVKAVRDQLLTRMAVRILTDRVRCSPLGNVGTPSLTVAALTPVEAAVAK